MKYNIKRFNLYKTKQHEYFYTTDTSATISNKNLAALLKKLRHEEIHTIDAEHLKKLIIAKELNYDQTLDFLINQLHVITAHHESQFQCLYIISDNDVVKKSLAQQFSSQYDVKIICLDTPQQIATSHSLALMFNENYNETDFKKLYSLAEREDTYFITALLMHNYLLIDNIYNKAQGVPCHFCSMEHLKSPVKTYPDFQNHTWLAFYRRLLHDDATIIPALPLNTINMNYVIYCLGRYLNNYLNPHQQNLMLEDANRFWHVNLDSGNIEKEAASHWPLCECLCA